MAGTRPSGPVVLFDDDHVYLGGVLAELLARDGLAVTLVTPAPLVSAWTVNTLEQVPIQKRLLELGVTILANQSVTRYDGTVARLACVFTGRESERPAASLVTVTARLPEDGLARDLAAEAERVAAAGIRSITAIGDGRAPGTIAAAVYAGHRYARELDEPPAATVPFRRALPLAVAG